MNRIMIIGQSGSGKSTLARTLGELSGLPIYHMDREVHWLPGWKERRSEDKTGLVERIIEREAWVFEGGHSRTYGLRIRRADLLLWLDLPLHLRLFRVVRRTIVGRGQTRPDMQQECPERLRMLPQFISFVLRTSRSSRAKQQRAFEEASCEKYRLSSPAAVVDLLEDLRRRPWAPPGSAEPSPPPRGLWRADETSPLEPRP